MPASAATPRGLCAPSGPRSCSTCPRASVRFTKPVVLLWGNADRFFKLELGRRLATAFLDARLVEIDGSRTFLSLDEPQRVADEIHAAAFYAQV
ncbi:MAG: hypothetical protein DLM58_04960 [Pseudonocardiales bacterium]|nr:MAG: hypothetical protein DLM58_04960 [Pseudonocardiales bacterium]